MIARRYRKFITLSFGVGLIFLTACDSPEERLQSHFEDAVQLVENGDDVKASLEFRNALQINPDHVPSLFGLSGIEERRANWQSVGSLLNKIVDLDPTHVEATIRLGRIALLAGEIDRALELSNSASKLAPENIDALSFKAAVLLNLEDTQGALAAARAALAIDPNNADAVSVLAAERIAAGDLTTAVALLDDQLAKNADNIALQLIKIRALAALEDISGVEEVLVSLTEFYPEAGAFRSALIRLYLTEERYDDAEATIRAVADDAPEELQPNVDVVRFLNTIRGFEAAEAHTKELIARGDQNQNSYRQMLTRLYIDSGRAEEAKAVLNEIVASDVSVDDRLAAQNQLAEFLRLEGKIDEAREAIAKILEEDQSNAGALTTRAAILISDRKYDDAIIDLRTVLRDDPQSVRAHLLLGGAHHSNGSIELADDQYARGYEASNGNIRVGVAYAEFLARRQAFGRAEQILLDVSRRNPDDTSVLRLLAQARINNQDWIGAEQVAERLRQLDEEESVVDRIVGLALQGQERFDQSIRAFERSQEAAPDANRPMASLVGAYVRAGQPEKAKVFLQTVLEESPKNAFAQVLLAQLLVQEDDLDGAEESFKRAIDRNPEANVAYTSFAGFYVAQGEPEKAAAVIEQGIEAIPEDAALRITLASLHEQTGDIEGALEIYRQLYEASPTSPILANNYAATLIDVNPNREAAEVALDAVQVLLTSSVPQFQDTVGRVYYLLGRYDQSLRYLERAAEQLPGLAIVRYHLGMAYRATESYAAAIEEFEAVVALSESQTFDKTEEVKGLIEELRAQTESRTEN